MLKRYVEIKTAAKQVESVEDLLPRASAHRKIERLYEELRALESVTKKLQSEDTTMADVRVLFDGVLQRYPSMDTHLSKETHIVHSPDFENGTNLGFADSLLHAGQKRRRQGPQGYNYDELLFRIPATSNRCERLFSQAKMVLTPQRSALLPIHFEMIMFLKVNSQYWSRRTVATAEALVSQQQA
eukprot:jgi/Phyca11/115295/e_gw1.28.544.1